MSQQQPVERECFKCHKMVWTKWEKEADGKTIIFYNDKECSKRHVDDKKPYSGSPPFTDAEDIAYIPIKEVDRIQNVLKAGYKFFGRNAVESHLQGLDTANSAIAVLIKPKYSASQPPGQPASKGAAVTN